MGQVTTLLIQHDLTASQILNLPERLFVYQNALIAGDWTWAIPGITENSLIACWARTADWFINNPWGWEDLPLLEKGNFTLVFSCENIVKFDSCLNWYVFTDDKTVAENFILLAMDIAKIFNATDALIISDALTYLLDEKATIDMIRKKAIADNQFYSNIPSV